jgi:hypothetical protein
MRGIEDERIDRFILDVLGVTAMTDTELFAVVGIFDDWRDYSRRLRRLIKNGALVRDKVFPNRWRKATIPADGG